MDRGIGLGSIRVMDSNGPWWSLGVTHADLPTRPFPGPLLSICTCKRLSRPCRLDNLHSRYLYATSTLGVACWIGHAAGGNPRLPVQPVRSHTLALHFCRPRASFGPKSRMRIPIEPEHQRHPSARALIQYIQYMSWG